jgi:hypothetical protein
MIGTIMNFHDSLTLATQRALDLDDLPQELLPLVISSEAVRLSALQADDMGAAAWH